MERPRVALRVFNGRIFMFLLLVSCLTAILMQKGYAESKNQPIEVSISAANMGDDDSFGLIEFKAVNTSGRLISFAKWDMPISGYEGNFFDVFYNGDPVPYVGPFIRRGPPTASDLVILRPGESIRVLVDLSRSYNISRSGHYFVQYRKILSSPSTGLGYREVREAPIVELRSRPVEFERKADGVAQNESKYPLESAAVPEMRPSIWYQFCSVQQQDVISSAHSLARSYASDARSSLALGIAGQRYRTWFGVVSAQRMSVVRSHFDNIDFATRSGSTEFFCNCTDASAYAYVNKSIPGRIHLCPLFWSASNTQRANTIIHELSHLSRGVGVGADGTEDYVYGQTQAEQLAYANPGYAVDSAENYGFYAQNPYGQSN